MLGAIIFKPFWQAQILRSSALPLQNIEFIAERDRADCLTASLF